MATTTFKQQCPSCETMVPIRDPSLIGRKIDCPKCKYRFVVEEPATKGKGEDGDKGKAKKADKSDAITTSKKPAAAAGKGKPGPKGERERKEGEANNLPMIIGLAVLGLVLLGAGAFVIFGGKKSGTPAAGGGDGGGGGGGDNNPPVNTGPSKPTPFDPREVTNILPGDSEEVANIMVARFLDSALKKAVFGTPTAFDQKEFEAGRFFALDQIERIIVARNARKGFTFTVVRLDEGAKLPPELIRSPQHVRVGNYEYVPVAGSLDPLATFLFRAPAGSNRQMAAHACDDRTLVVTDVDLMVNFLKNDRKQPTKTPRYVPKKDNQGNQGNQGGMGAMGGVNPPTGGMGGMGPPGPPMGGPVGPPMGGGQQVPGDMGGGPVGPPMQGGGGQGPPNQGGGQTGGDGSPPEVVYPNTWLSLEPSMKQAFDVLKDSEQLICVVTLGRGRKAARHLLGKSLMEDLEVAEENAHGLGLKKFDDDAIEAHEVLAFSGVGGASTANRFLNTEPDGWRAKAKKLQEEIEKTLKIKAVFLDGSPAPTDPNNNFMGGPPFMGGVGAMGGGPVGPPNSGGLGAMGGAGATGGFGARGTGPQGPPGPQGPSGGFKGGVQPPPVGPPMAGNVGVPPMNFMGGPNFAGNQGGVGGNLGNQGGTPNAPNYIRIGQQDKVLTAEVRLKLDSDKFKLILDRITQTVIEHKNSAVLADSTPRFHDLAQLLARYVQVNKAFPRGTYQSGGDPLTDLPGERLSWIVELLPPRLKNSLTDKHRWKSPANRGLATTVLPQLLSPYLPDEARQREYPHVGKVAVTHFVGVAGLGEDAATLKPGDPQWNKRGVFNYEIAVKESDITDGLDRTIALLMVSADRLEVGPWIAGGGSTVRGVPEENSLEPFLSTWKVQENGKEVTREGTIAIMADGKVRFIPKTIKPELFRAMCTIAGGEPISTADLDREAPELKGGAEVILKPAPIGGGNTGGGNTGGNSGGNTGGGGQTTTWQTITSKEGGFTVEMPSGKRDDKKMPLGNAGTLFAVGFKTTTEDDYGVAYVELAQGVSAETLLEQLLTPILQMVNVKSNTRTSFFGKPGREIVGTLKQGGGDAFLRTAIVGNRIYMWGVTNEKGGKIPPENVKRFYDSFKLTQ